MFDTPVMTRRDLWHYNQKAHKIGRHMCTACLGEFDYTEANFYRSSKYRKDGTVILMAVCRTCQDADSARRAREQYQTNEATRERRQRGSREYQRGLSRAAKAAKLQKRKRRQMERILGKAV